ncbi:nuclear transport factor 2 family protein [Salinibacterium sp. NSLL150]|uniref:nuclear transport factor 2 family protein n=1 Tax=unclassified Salinibacterium TaxID=2632331 RepID=UPI0018CCCCC1|nr:MULTISPECIES: nuclear transport factor 2 family protein [unclassified Salinibacterium]MBH0025108.1 nuclear transport factor 2 family protein [Salinibacterium sp. SWN248]MBH0100005.1 nuclear transport factor 2 family protein [Salinibacterium sp. NSLL35]MBH0102759.1 nuclear transport factor 2 family protein [Salinibacterium sp. NSLL150]MBH0105519.1 nuclear transport factor 2 family protein [Salinibacterium sp. NSLL16]MBH0108279.1 nuclear transport factor 2 family protein [Salinibacterium sp. 
MTEDAYSAAQQLLYRYGAIADAKDIPAALELFRRATVTFPQRTVAGDDQLTELYSELWGKPNSHRHIITNVRLVESELGYSAVALYTRWEFTPAPLLTTMGEYEMSFSRDGHTWGIDSLIVTRTWPVS